MRKLLRPRDVLLLGLAGALDVFEEIKDPFGLKARGSDLLYGWVPERYRRHNFSRVVARRLQTGDLEKVIKEDEVYLRLTTVGKERVIRDFPMLGFVNQKWDKKWRIVIFDIEEIDKKIRESLRDKLRQLGFGMLQESVWITPHDVSVDIREFLESKNLDDRAFVLEVSAVLAGDQELLVRKIWNLDALEEAYNEVITAVKEILDMYVTSSGRNQQHTSRKQNKLLKELKNIRQRYVETILSDPLLPKDVLPRDWPATEARSLIRKLGKIVNTL